MSTEPVRSTYSPSMDIQISSNFERLLFDLCGQDAVQLRAYMDDLKNTNGFSVSLNQLEQAREIFVAGRADDHETLATIAGTYKKHNYILDPHTAVGVKVAHDLAAQLPQPVICLATAHPAKFPEYRQSRYRPHTPAAFTNGRLDKQAGTHHLVACGHTANSGIY